MRNERIVVLNDIHIPYQDNKTLQAVERGVKYLKPNKIILAGDIVDFYTVSRFEKDPSRKLDLEDEVGQAKDWLKGLVKQNPRADIIYFDGNHEDRLKKYVINNAPELHWVDGVRLPSLLGLKDIGVRYHPKRYYEYKGVLYSHLNRSNKYGGYTAKNLGSDFGKNVVHGHSHKVGHVAVGDTNFYDNGCLCDMNVDYMEGPSLWTQAFMVVDMIGNKPFFTQIPISDHKFVLDGRLFTPEGYKKIKK